MKKVVAAVIEEGGKLLIAKRKSDNPTESRWEFPGGKIEPGETPQECLRREIEEELSIHINIGQFIMTNVYSFYDFTIELSAYFAKWVSGLIRLNDHEEIAWVSPEQLELYDISPADRPIAKRIIELRHTK